MDTPSEIWKVDVDGSIYDADTETLRQWILDGYLTPQTKVQKGSLKWIELARVPAFRGLFGGDLSTQPPPAPVPTAPTWGPPEPAPVYGFTPPEPAARAYAAPGGPTSGPSTTCLNHPTAAAKYVCQGCHASLCLGCVKRYGSAGVCTICGELCKAVAEAVVETQRKQVLEAGYGFGDFALALRYPFKDPIALVFTALVYGFLLLFGVYGKAFAGALLFGYISHAVRRVSMGHYDEGPSPDLGDLSELVFEAGKLGIAVSLITYGPLVTAVFFTLGEIFSGGGLEDLTALGAGAIGIVLALLWAAFYYPMALLVAGYTNSFVSTINPIVGLATMARLRLDYVKAYLMCLAVFILQVIFTRGLGFIGPLAENVPNTILQALAYLLQYIVQGSVVFVASMIIAALLGLVLFKRPDVVDLDV